MNADQILPTPVETQISRRANAEAALDVVTLSGLSYEAGRLDTSIDGLTKAHCYRRE